MPVHKRSSLASRNKSEAASSTRKPSTLLLIAMCALLIYFILPVFWLVVASTKDVTALFNSFGLWFADGISFADNVVATVQHQDGIFIRWMLNTVLYVGVSAVGATLLCALAGYGFSKFRFPGSNTLFASVVGAIMVPVTALAIPTYLIFTEIRLVDTPFAMILPSLVSPFGLYLMRIYADSAIPDSLIEAARIDGAGELRIFFTVALRLLAPGTVTVLLFTIVTAWNNYLLPLVMFNTSSLYPITVGLAAWSSQTAGAAGASGSLISIVITGSLLSIIPLVVAFLVLQRYWQSGLAAGSVKQ